MSQVIGLPNNSCKPITKTAWVRAWLCKLQKRVHSTLSTPGTLVSFTTKTGRYDIADILLKVALKHQKSINKDHLLVAIFTVITTLDVYMFTTAGVRCNKITNKTFHTVGTVTKSNLKILSKPEAKSIPLRHICATAHFHVLIQALQLNVAEFLHYF